MLSLIKNKLKQNNFKKLYLEHLEKYRTLEAEKSLCKDELKKEQLDNLMLDLNDTFELLRETININPNSIKDSYKFEKLSSTSGILFDCLFCEKDLYQIIKDRYTNINNLIKECDVPKHLENIINKSKDKKIKSSNLKHYLKKALLNKQKEKDNNAKKNICSEFENIDYTKLSKHTFELYLVIKIYYLRNRIYPIFLEPKVMYSGDEIFGDNDYKFIKELLHKYNTDLILI